MEQWMDCVTPLKNLAKRLQKERFNSLNYTAMVVLWLDKNVSDFLDHFTNNTNNLACIVRSFAGLEYLRVLTAVTVIIGVHLVEPYPSLTTSSSTTLEKLVESFPTLYTDLTTTKAKLLLDLLSSSSLRTDSSTASIQPTSFSQQLR